MKKNRLKITITAFIFIGLLLISLNLYVHFKKNDVKNLLLQNKPEIENIESINSVGKWGEWFSEYVLVVEIDGHKYRVWINEKGEITDQENL